MADRIIYAEQVLLPEAIQSATIYIKNGKIVDLHSGPPPGESQQLVTDHIDRGLLMPGLADVHVHINEPGRSHWEGFDTATRAAAAGGITTLVDMPLNSEPVTTSPGALQQKITATENQTHVNLGFWGGVVPSNAGQLDPLLNSGVLGLKAFLVHSGIDSFPNVSEQDLIKAMPALQKAGLPLLVHCELPSEHADLKTIKSKPHSYPCWVASRPADMELRAIEMMIRLCEKFRCKTHIVHLTSAEALPMIAAAQKRGLPLTVETCPHYLYFYEENIPDGNCRFKCAPPIRHQHNNALLLKALENDQIDFIASDHSPAPPETKHLDSGNLLEAWGGIASVQLMLPVMWTLLRKRKNALQLLVEKMIHAPLRFAGLHTQKGKMAIGYDADFVVWNPHASFSVKEEDLHFRHPATCPYLGEQLYGKVEKTYVNGQLVFDQNQIKTLNSGKLLLHGQ